MSVVMYAALAPTSYKVKFGFGDVSPYVRGAIPKFVDKRKEINTNNWIRLKIYEYIQSYFDITMNGFQNFR